MICLQSVRIVDDRSDTTIDFSANPDRYSWNKHAVTANTASNCLIVGGDRSVVFNSVAETLLYRIYDDDKLPTKPREYRKMVFVSDDHHRFEIEYDIARRKVVNASLTIDGQTADYKDVETRAIDYVCSPQYKQTSLHSMKESVDINDRFARFLANTYKLNNMLQPDQQMISFYNDYRQRLAYYMQHLKSYATTLDHICRLTDCGLVDGIEGFTVEDDIVYVMIGGVLYDVKTLIPIDNRSIISDIAMINLFKAMTTTHCEATACIDDTLYDSCNVNVINAINQISAKCDVQLIAATNNFAKCTNRYSRPDSIFWCQSNTTVSLANKCQSRQIKQRDDLSKLLVRGKFS